MNDFKTCAVDKYKEKSPNYSLSMRYNAPGDKTGKPGPGAYMSEKVNIVKIMCYGGLHCRCSRLTPKEPIQNTVLV